MRSFAALVALIQVASVAGLYADQVGTLDRVEKYIGPINALLQFPASQQAAKSTILAITDAQVAAGLNARTGEYVWRYVAASDEQIVASATGILSTGVAFAALVVTTNRGSSLRLLRQNDGRIAAETQLAQKFKAVEHANLIAFNDQVSILLGGKIYVFNVKPNSVQPWKTFSPTDFPGNRDARKAVVAVAYINGVLNAVLLSSEPSANPPSLFQLSDQSFVNVYTMKLEEAAHIVDSSLTLLSVDGKAVISVLSKAGRLYAGAPFAATESIELPSLSPRGLGLRSLARVSDSSDITLEARDEFGAGALVVLQVVSKAAVDARSGDVQGDSSTLKLTLAGSLDAEDVAVSFAENGMSSTAVARAAGVDFTGAASQDASWKELSHLIGMGVHGRVSHLFCIPSGKDSAFNRVLAVFQDGHVVAFQHTWLWERSEGHACIEQVLPVDVSTRELSSESSYNVNTVSLQERFQDQTRIVGSWVSSLAAAAADPVRTIFGSSARSSVMQAVTAGTDTFKADVRRSQLSSHGRCAAGRVTSVRGSLSGVTFDSGRTLWERTYPITEDIRAARSAAYYSKIVYSRQRPLQQYNSEILLIEAAFDGRESIVGFVWLDAATGATVNKSSSRMVGSIASIAKLPIVQSEADRDVYVALFERDHTMAGVVAPSGSSVETFLRQSTGTFSVTSRFFSADDDVDGVMSLRLLSAGDECRGTLLCKVGTSVSWQSVFGSRASKPDGQRLLAIGGSAPRPIVLGTDNDALTSAAFAALEGDAHVIPAQITGEDSLLLKFLDHNMIFVVFGTAGQIAGKQETPFHPSKPMKITASSSTQEITLQIIDATTGRVLHSRHHASATGPIAAVLHENWIVYSYWNAKVSRPELAVVTLYDGAVDTYDVSPWNTRVVSALPSGKISSFGQDMPFAIQRSFVLPIDGVLMLDKRLLDPRRPTKEPTEPEKAEGLMQYSQVLPLRHTWFISYNTTIHGLRLVSSAPSTFESTTLISAVGVDHFYSCVAPSKPFDQLDPSFSLTFFFAVIAVAGFLVVLLGQFAQRKALTDAWQ